MSESDLVGADEYSVDAARDENKNKGLRKRISLTNVSLAPNLTNVSASQILALRQTVNRYSDELAKILLSSEESLKRRRQIESAFCVCRDAFLELSSAYLNALEHKASPPPLSEDLKSHINKASDAFNSLRTRIDLAGSVDGATCVPSTSTNISAKTYASACSAPVIRVSRGPVLDIPKTTNFIVTPSDESGFATSRETRNALEKTLKPSEYDLKVCKISSVRKNGIRIEAHSVDLAKLRKSQVLDRAGLRLEQEAKINPRLIVHGIPCAMKSEDLKKEISLNLKNVESPDIRVIYIFPPKDNRRSTSCIIEVSPEIHVQLLKDELIFVNYSVCKVADYVKVLQCFKCLAFGHFARHCKFPPLCGHCADGHKSRDCASRARNPMCGNCKRWLPHEKRSHSALDCKNCPILRKRVSDRIKIIDYGL
ncbi:uncharacterized protein LOC105203880 [Solenopsis invicta]|uniref:uncharacterized protein LOC105203880 n=1 Tax=Solenopsis invicta TaxID=13686 RepID=UPI00059586FE|nr:uncharacterized protein LOC105203880 [Solenopsis invicta]